MVSEFFAKVALPVRAGCGRVCSKNRMKIFIEVTIEETAVGNNGILNTKGV